MFKSIDELVTTATNQGLPAVGSDHQPRNFNQREVARTDFPTDEKQPRYHEGGR